MNGGPGQPNPVGKLRKAETLRFSGKGTEYLANARDDLDAAGCFRRPGKLCLRVCHNASLFDRAIGVRYRSELRLLRRSQDALVHS